jgi:hypothetical protein
MFPDPAGSLDAIHTGHLQIHQDHVRPDVGDQIDSLSPIVGYSGHFNSVGRFQDGLQPFQNDILIITN